LGMTNSRAQKQEKQDAMYTSALQKEKFSF